MFGWWTEPTIGHVISSIAGKCYLDRTQRFKINPDLLHINLALNMIDLGAHKHFNPLAFMNSNADTKTASSCLRSVKFLD